VFFRVIRPLYPTVGSSLANCESVTGRNVSISMPTGSFRGVTSRRIREVDAVTQSNDWRNRFS